MAENERKITTISFPSYIQSVLSRHIKTGSTYIPTVRKENGQVVIELREADNGGDD